MGGSWNDEPEFTPEIGQQALKSAGHWSGDRFTIGYSKEKFDVLMQKHGAAPTEACMCYVGIAETFKLGIWGAGAFAKYFDCDCKLKIDNGNNVLITIDIGYPPGELNCFQQFIFDMKRLLRHMFGHS